MHNRPHPGEFIKEICFEPLGLTITEAALKLNVTRKALSELINGKSGISVEMALRLAKAFNTTAESWLTQQMLYDLWKTEQKKIRSIENIQPFLRKNFLSQQKKILFPVDKPITINNITKNQKTSSTCHLLEVNLKKGKTNISRQKKHA
jgi:addiction module HigA family antidote